MACFIGNQEVDCAMWNATQHTEHGSQFWLEKGYTGQEPDLATKAAFSTAEYARDWIGTYAKTLVGSGATDISPNVEAIAKYPVTTPYVEKIWNAYPITSPIVATAKSTVFKDPTATNAPPSPVSGGGAGSIDPYQAPVVSDMGTIKLPSGETVTIPTGTTDGETTTTGGLSSILSSGLLIPAVIAIAIIALVWMALKSRGRGVAA